MMIISYVTVPGGNFESIDATKIYKNVCITKYYILFFLEKLVFRRNKFFVKKCIMIFVTD